MKKDNSISKEDIKREYSCCLCKKELPEGSGRYVFDDRLYCMHCWEKRRNEPQFYSFKT